MAVILGLILLIALTPMTALAGDPRGLFMAASTQHPITITANSINGVTLVANDDYTDTGTGYGASVGTNPISVLADCDTTSGGTAAVYLYANDVLADSVVCGSPGIEASDTLTAAVTGSYTARVYGTRTGAGFFHAGAPGAFNFPVALTDWTSKPPAGTALRTDGHWSVSGLVGAWPFNEGSGTTATNVVDSTTSTITSPTWSGGGLAFSGTHYTATVPSGAMTYVVGFSSTDTAAGRKYLLDKHGPSIVRDAGNLSARDTSSSTNYGSVYIADGNPHVAALTAPSTTASASSFYVDGTLASAATVSTLSDTTLHVGEYFGTSFNFLGTMQFVLYYNRSLTSAEISSLSANPWQIFAQH